METYLIYISKVAIATGAFYLTYLVLFQNRKHFVFNRVYLPAVLALSFIIPLITFTMVNYIETPVADMSSYAWLSASTEVVQQSKSDTLWPHYLFGFYLLGTAGFLFHLIAGHFKAMVIISRSQLKTLSGYRVYVTEKDVHPFSFFNKIVISEPTLNSPNLRLIIDHEHIHVREKHTVDILVTELLFILQWFNPFAWLLRDEVKNNLEFKTDDEIVKNNDPITYQLAMVTLADKQGVAPFLTALNGSQLKSRIIMMKKKNENRFLLLKQLVILPLLAVLVMGLAGRDVKTEYIQKQNNVVQLQPEIGNEINVSGKVTNEKGEPLAGVAVLIKGKPVGTITDDSGNYQIQLGQADTILVFALPGYEKQEIITKGKVKSDVELKPIRSEGSLRLKSGEPGTSAQMLESTSDFNNTNERLYVVDGKITGNITQIPPEDVENIKILKDNRATSKYGQKGKNGVMEITTKSKSYSYLDDDAQNVRPQPTDKFVRPEVMPEFPGGYDALKQYIAENTIYPEDAREKGIQGKVYVSFKVTKEGKIFNVRLARGIYPPLDQEAIRVIRSMPDWKPGMTDGQPVDVPGMGVPVDFVIKNPVVKVTSYAQSLVIPGPLYIVDGEETKSIKDIDHDDIAHISVLNDAASLAVYGQRGKDGVILITTKEGQLKNKLITELQLRRFIAERIKYPAEARQAGTHGRVDVVIELGKNNQVVSAGNYALTEVYDLDDVVVTGYGGKNIPSVSPEKNSPLLVKEVERVLQLMPVINIPTIDKKFVRVTVEFKLEPEE